MNLTPDTRVRLTPGHTGSSPIRGWIQPEAESVVIVDGRRRLFTELTVIGCALVTNVIDGTVWELRVEG